MQQTQIILHIEPFALLSLRNLDHMTNPNFTSFGFVSNPNYTTFSSNYFFFFLSEPQRKKGFEQIQNEVKFGFVM